MQIDFNITDDLNVSLDPDNYQDATDPAPPPAGNYRIHVEKWAVKKTREGEVILDQNDAGKPVFPRIVLEMVKIVEPFPFTDRRVGLYQDFKTKPTLRYGEPVNALADLTRSLDQKEGFNGLQAGLELFGNLVQTNDMSVAMDWYWNDQDYVTNRMDEEFGGRNYGELTPDEKKIAGEIYNKGKLQGMKRNRLPSGKISHVWTNPNSGNKVTARIKIVKFFPSLASVRYHVVEA